MFRNILAALSCAVFSLTVMVNDAFAVFVTEQATFQMRDPDDGPPLLQIKRVDSSGGHVFTNQFDSPTGPFGTGAEIRSISASQLQTAINGESFQPLQDSRAGFAGNDLIAIAAIRGEITSSTPPSSTATFTEGRLYIVSVAQGTFDPRNPDTWNFGGAFVEFNLATPEDVIPGSGQALVFDASTINQSSANSTADVQAQGRFLFEEDSTAAQNAIPDSGDAWMSVTSTVGIPTGEEGLLSQTTQTVEVLDFENLGLTATDLAVLNAIFADMATKAGLGPLVFATGLGPGLDSNFNPQFPPPAGDGPTGDFRAELQTRNAPGAFAIIPEPASFVLLCVGFGVVGLSLVLRRRQSFKTADEA